jgi:hypothetical protein
VPMMNPKPPYLITVRSLIRGVSEEYKSRRNFDGDCPIVEKNREILHRLQALDVESCTAEDVAEIMGNGGWTELPKCGQCGERSDPMIVLGRPEPESIHDYDNTAYLCLSCLDVAWKMVFEVDPETLESVRKHVEKAYAFTGKP